MIVNSAENNVAPSIAKKPTKRSGTDFAKFLYNLGKTDKPSKEAEVKTISQNKIPPKNPKLDNYKPIQQPKPIFQNNLIQKTALDIDKDSVNNQLDANQKAPIIKPETFSPLIDDSKEIVSPKSNDELFKKLLQNKPQNDNLTKNDIKKPNEPVKNDNIIRPQKDTTKDNPKTIAKEEQNNKDPQKQIQTTNAQIANNDIKNPESKDLKQTKADELANLDSNIIRPNTNKNTKDIEKPNDVKNLNDVKTPNESKNDIKMESKASQIQKDQKDTPKEKNDIQNDSNDALINNFLKDDSPKFSTLSDDEVKLSLKDTLKYGAFKAFDALSLLKPSDGKKLSDLIKKADELSLNLTKIQHKKEVSKPSEADNKKPLDLKNADLKTKIESTKDMPSTPQKQEAIQDTNTNNQQANNQENEIKNIAKADNKIPDSKLDTKPNDKENMNNKDDKQDNLQNQKKDIKDTSKSPQKQEVAQNPNQQNNANLESKPMQKEANNDLKEMIQQDSNIEKNPDLKPASFKPNNKKEIKNDNDAKQTNNDKNVDSINTNNVKNDQVQRNSDLKDTFNGFARALKQEIINYKPPLSKLTLELNPANLGSIEVNITHQGKNLQLQLNGNQNTINLFIQNQSDLRSALSQIGYENVTMSFSNGSQMGFSDSKGNWNFKHLDRGVNNIDDDLDNEMANLEITLVNNYA